MRIKIVENCNNLSLVQIANQIQEKKKVLDVRIDSIQKQEDSLKEKTKSLRDEIVKEMENEKK